MRRAIAILAAALIAVATASTALAGGWAITTVDSMPEEFDAGGTYAIEYTVRQHGQHPADAGPSHVTLQNPEGKQSLRFDAENLGNGRYRVEITLPTEGIWTWEVAHGFGPQSLGSIEVSRPGAATGGFDLVDGLKVILPLATLIAAVLTVREWSRARAPEGETV